MVERDIAGRGVDDAAVLAAMRRVPRETFVPDRIQAEAFADHPLPIGEGQTISQPLMVAVMAEEAQLSPTDHVLEIGTGSGYGAAVLRELSASVVTVERHRSLADEAGDRLVAAGYDDIEVVVGDGTLGWPDHAPYDAIVVTAAGPDVPEPLLDQLATGGRVIMPVGPKGFDQELIRVTLTDNGLRRERLGGVRFVPLVGEYGFDR